MSTSVRKNITHMQEGLVGEDFENQYAFQMFAQNINGCRTDAAEHCASRVDQFLIAIMQLDLEIKKARSNPTPENIQGAAIFVSLLRHRMQKWFVGWFDEYAKTLDTDVTGGRTATLKNVLDGAESELRDICLNAGLEDAAARHIFEEAQRLVFAED